MGCRLGPGSGRVGPPRAGDRCSPRFGCRGCCRVAQGELPALSCPEGPLPAPALGRCLPAAHEAQTLQSTLLSSVQRSSLWEPSPRNPTLSSVPLPPPQPHKQFPHPGPCSPAWGLEGTLLAHAGSLRRRPPTPPCLEQPPWGLGAVCTGQSLPGGGQQGPGRHFSGPADAGEPCHPCSSLLGGKGPGSVELPIFYFFPEIFCFCNDQGSVPFGSPGQHYQLCRAPQQAWEWALPAARCPFSGLVRLPDGRDPSGCIMAIT